jgi:hypothetical protein
MEQNQARDHLQVYLSMFTSLKALPRGECLTEEAALRWLVDESYRAAKLMIQTHLIADKLRFVKLARIVELHGYQMIWFKHKNTVGVTRKDALQGASPTTLEAT